MKLLGMFVALWMLGCGGPELAWNPSDNWSEPERQAHAAAVDEWRNVCHVDLRLGESEHRITKIPDVGPICGVDRPLTVGCHYLGQIEIREQTNLALLMRIARHELGHALWLADTHEHDRVMCWNDACQPAALSASDCP